MAEYQLPAFWPEFVASVKEQNAFTTHGALRRYQTCLLDTGEFAVVSPFSGKPVESRTSAYGMPDQLAYYFRDSTNFWLLSAQQFKLGQPLTQIVMEHDAGRHFLSSGERQPEQISAKQMNDLRESAGRALQHHTRSVTLVIGHRNFAHHLWNELPALDAWLNRASDEAVARLSVVATAEPLGPLRDIFPRLANASFKTSIANSAEIPLLLRVGSQAVTKRIRQTMVDYLNRQNKSSNVINVLQVLASGWPRIWISVREGYRTPDNQLEFLLAIMQSIVGTYPDSAFVFDGFSFPIGFFQDERTRHLRELFVQRSKRASQFIDKLRERVAIELGQNLVSRMCDLSGFDLAEAVSVAGHCDYYVCHGGTLQHKIGWFYNKPGFIHAPPGGLTYFLKRAKRAGGVIPPDLLRAELTLATSEPEGVPRVDCIPRNYNYRILDVKQAAEAILISMRSRLKRIG